MIMSTSLRVFVAVSVALGVGGGMRPAAAAEPAQYEATWESLKQYEVPAWYRDAKFGIFIHWGVYAVPAFGSEWYPRTMYTQGSPEFKHHIATFGPHAQFGYKDFIARFKAEKFDAREWAALFKASGAKYVVPVAEHHDGFPMYDSALTEWCAAKKGPMRDIVGELAEAVRAEGLVFGVSSHRAEHWWFFNEGMKFDSDVRAGTWDSLYGPAQPEKPGPNKAYLDDWLARCRELVDKYQPQLFWFDWWIEQPEFEPYLQQFAAYYYNQGIAWQKGVAINYKNKSFPDEAAVLDIERGKLGKIREHFWQTDTSVSIKSWGYIENDRFRSVDSLVHELVDIVSKNGCLLLNIGPKADGTIPREAQDILRGIGDWLRVNGDAVYGTRPWKIAGEGPTAVKSGSFSDHKEKPQTARDFRFTARDGAIYAICMGWPEKEFRIASLGKTSGIPVTEVTMLGESGTLRWNQKKDALVVRVPKNKPCASAYALKIVPDETKK